MGKSKTTARDQAFFMRTLKQYIPGRHWDYARSLLASITPLAALGHRSSPLRGWNLQFKGGWGSGTGWVNHQVVRLAKDGLPYRARGYDREQPLPRVRKQTLEGVFRILLRDLPR